MLALLTSKPGLSGGAGCVPDIWRDTTFPPTRPARPIGLGEVKADAVATPIRRPNRRMLDTHWPTDSSCLDIDMEVCVGAVYESRAHDTCFYPSSDRDREVAKKKPESTTFFCVLLHPFCENQAFRQAADGFTWYNIQQTRPFHKKKHLLGLPSPPGPPSPSGRANRRLCLHLLPSMDYEVSESHHANPEASGPVRLRRLCKCLRACAVHRAQQQ